MHHGPVHLTPVPYLTQLCPKLVVQPEFCKGWVFIFLVPSQDPTELLDIPRASSLHHTYQIRAALGSPDIHQILRTPCRSSFAVVWRTISIELSKL